MKKVVAVLFLMMISFNLQAQTIAPVLVSSVVESRIAETVEGHGVIKPFPKDDARLSALSPMRIDEIFVKPGDRVKKGQRIIKLQRDHSLDMSIEKARIALQQADTNLKRARKLFDSGVIARVMLEHAQTDYDLAQADFELQKRSLNYAIENSLLRSPINGVASSVNAVVGQIADPSQVLVHIVNMKTVIADIGIETENINKIKIDMQSNISIPNLPDKEPYRGRIIKINREIDAETQLIHIWIEVENPNQTLQPGMFAAAKIFSNIQEKALVVPRSSVLSNKKGYYVYVVEENVAHKVNIVPGIITDKLVQIENGLKIGQKIVYQGNYELEDQMKVEIINKH